MAKGGKGQKANDKMFVDAILKDGVDGYELTFRVQVLDKENKPPINCRVTYIDPTGKEEIKDANVGTGKAELVYNGNLPYSLKELEFNFEAVADDRILRATKLVKFPAPTNIDLRAGKVREIGDMFRVILTSKVIDVNGNIRKPFKIKFLVGEDEIEHLPTSQRQDGVYFFTLELPIEDTGKEIPVKAQVSHTFVERAITLRLPPLLAIVQKENTVFSGGELTFKYKSDKDITPEWRVENLGLDTGTVDINNGVYKAPAVIKEEKEVWIVLKDRNTGRTAKSKIKLLSIRMIPDAQEPRKQPKLHAGGKSVQLPIESRHDLRGLRNYSCKIKSSPNLGKVEEGGMYTPPPYVDNLTVVEVVAQSNTDPDKKASIQFEVDIALCPKCGQETDRDGRCPACGEYASYGSFVRDRGTLPWRKHKI